MHTLGPKRSSRWPGAMLPCLFSGLIAAAALASPAAFADGKQRAHSDGAMLSSTQTWGKQKQPPSGPHPDDTVHKSAMKNRTPNQ
ncbi:hypothetical protein ACV229_27300 [Burkholderia sp. MR1-5-21]